MIDTHLLSICFQVLSSCDASEEKSLRGLESSVTEEETDLEDSDFLNGFRYPDVQAQGDFYFGDGELDPLSADQLEVTRFQVRANELFHQYVIVTESDSA